MTPTLFPQCNCSFTAPSDLADSQVMTIPGFKGEARSGSVDGVELVVVAWMPTEREKKMIADGEPIYISFLGGIPPHFPCMTFEEACNPA